MTIPKYSGFRNYAKDQARIARMQSRLRPQDANEVLCRILKLETLSIGTEPVLKYTEVLAAFERR